MVQKGRGSYENSVKRPPKPSPVSNIAQIASLTRYPDKDYAVSILHEVAKAVAPIIHENNFKVGTLCEMFPKNPNLLGLNVNGGQKILLRLRHSFNDRSFLPTSDIIETFLHELTHNLHSAHDKKFYDFLDGLKRRYEQIKYGGGSNSNYRCEEEKLGSKYSPLPNLVSVREKRIKELSKPKYKAEVRVLGSGSSSSGSTFTSGTSTPSKVRKPELEQKSIRQLILEAAERRQRDSKWCHSETVEKEEVPDDNELDIIEIHDDEDEVSQTKEISEVVDLTGEEHDESTTTAEQEVVVIDGVTVQLEAGWNSTTFLISLIEAISGYDESLYIPTIETIFNLAEDDDEDFELYDATHHQIYFRVISRIGVNEESTSFINFNLVNKIYTPRVASHYDYYSAKVLPLLGSRLQLECARDSFGNEVERDSEGKLPAWLLYNNKFYCSSSDLFALQTDNSKSDEEVLKFDRVIGDNAEAPLLILYGNPDSPITKEFFIPLYNDAKAGKIRFVWRYIPGNTKQPESLSGYGVEVNLRNQDYFKEEKVRGRSKLDITKDFNKINESKELLTVSKDRLDDKLGLKFTSFVLSSTDKYQILKTMLNNFPKFLHHIANIPKLLNYESVKASVYANEDLGISQDSYGFYINGSPIHPLELDVLNLHSKLQTELKIIKNLVKLGFSTIQSKLLITKFALLSAVKQTQFRTGNTLMGNNENRFRVFENKFTKSSKGGVVFFNDIENDVTYDTYSTDRQDTYLGPSSFKLKSNQIPPLKENIHDLIFAMNLANKNQLKVFFTLSKVILDSGIPQQVGIIPIIGDDDAIMDKRLADGFYFLVEHASSKEALAFVYKYFESSEEEFNELLKLIPNHKLSYDYETVLNKFSIEKASVIFNGVINDLTSTNWQINMGKQLSQDINWIKTQLKQGNNIRSLKDLIYSNAKTQRNLRIVPLEPSEILYKPIDQELQAKSILFRSMDKSNEVGYTYWLFSSFNEDIIIEQLISLLEMVKQRKEDIQVRVVNTSTTFKLLEQLSKNFRLNMLTNSQIDQIIEELKKVELSQVNLDSELVKFLEKKSIPVNHSFMLVNSRYFRLDDPFNLSELNQIAEFEHSQRLKLFNDILQTYPDQYNHKSLNEFGSGNLVNDPSDWFDLVCSTVTKSFHVDDKLFIVDVNRFDFASLDMSNAIEPQEKRGTTELDVLVILDPLSETSQKMVSILESIQDFPFVSIKILVQPKVNSEFNIHRFYKGVYPGSTPKFNEQGNWINKYAAEVGALPSDQNVSIDLDMVNRWHVTSKSISNDGIDIHNMKVSSEQGITVKFELSSIIHEGYARDIHTGMSPQGLSFNLVKDDITSDTLVMSTLNYFQIRTNVPGVWKLSLSQEKFNLLSASENKFDANSSPLEYAEIPVFSLKGLTLYPRVVTKADNTTNVSKPTTQKADINVFSIAGGGEYERLLGIMIASVRKQNTNKSVKFWLLDNYMSPQFKRLLPILAKQYNVEYELITYKWPNWLRKQKEKRRTIWGYKILFLDVLFPQDLDKIIFIDADQICRTDLTELINIDLEGAPYGFTPMCDSREEMEGFRFWKQGYWSKVLKEDLKYHISALFVVDLKKFREIHAGDRLRSHYQKLSSDPTSLSNLDQDLPNNLQRSIKIFSLPQEWLWCETWCSNESLSSAKMIDLCNNPLTKENKFDIAKRLMPEWNDYNNEILELYKEASVVQTEPEEDDTSAEKPPLSQEEQENEDDSDYHDEL
ncbi:UDP-glucose:glycoprotein glucosyltransferase [Spathaspora sp. JA1]|nr:UDP-glucose:glycoprotein glucosyltransferase [Spathaspora sp. JA1]